MRQIAAKNSFLRFADGVRLSGQGGLVYLEIAFFNKTCVGRNLVALGENDNIAGHKLLGKNTLLLTVTNNVCIRG